jgi:UDP:flavonoid glycosyltransferase YjiC (YdhE family)
MRVLFTTTAGWGHVHPLVPLANAFVERGDEVMFAASSDTCARLVKDGFEVSPSGGGQSEHWAEFRCHFPEFDSLPSLDRPDFLFPRMFGRVKAPPMLKDLLPVAQAWKPSLIVHEQGELAAPIVAATLGVPNVTHAFGSVVPKHRVAAASGWVEPLWAQQGLQPRPYGGCYDHLYLDIYPKSLSADEVAHIPNVQSIRPVTFASGGDEQLPDWVRAGADRPLVYVTFGTVFNDDVSLFRTVIDALSQLAVRAVVTVGPAGDPILLGEHSADIFVARYIPQTQLLPYCTAVVSHAGSGTFLAALSHGLPQLCVPQAADQFRNADSCERSGAGLALRPGQVTVEGVRNAVSRLLGEGPFRNAAWRLRQELQDMPAPDEVAELMMARFGLS